MLYCPRCNRFKNHKDFSEHNRDGKCGWCIKCGNNNMVSKKSKKNVTVSVLDVVVIIE